MSNMVLKDFTGVFNPDKFAEVTAWCQEHNIHYGLGSKIEPLFSSPPTFKYSFNPMVDCSGFHRYIIWHATHTQAGNGLIIPDGSVQQNDWYYDHDFFRVRGTLYKDYVLTYPEQFFACFCRAGENGQSIGHVWIVHHGWTFESWGGHGPGSRIALNPILEHICTDMYRLG